MARFLHQVFQPSHRRMYWLPLAFFFLLGLFTGGWIFLQTDPSYTSLMCLAMRSRVSIVGLAGVLLLPFLFSTFAVSLGWPRLLFLIAYGKACTFSCVALCVLTAYGTGGWLAFPLLLFSDVCILPCLWLFWVCHLGGQRCSWQSLASYMIAAAAVGSVDYYIISPFLACL